ncbi:MAG: short-chain dehydrogenase/reductase [Fibrobacteres bacterium]|nr:short-chain dehydrogenase/reductase [Fibrobacterota bacterium]
MTQTVFITGVSSGIGFGLAKEWLDRGARVYGISRRAPPGLAEQPGFSFASVDLSDLKAISPAVERLLEGVQRLDMAVLNAGIQGDIGDMGETSLENMRLVMDVNVWSNKPVLDALFAGGRQVGQVVAISSGAAVSASRGWNAYSMSKASLNMMMKLYAAERPGTHFSALAPGLVDTAMQERMRAVPADARFASVERLRKAHGTPEMPTPEALAPRLLDAMERLRALKSGEFGDVRTLH